MAVNNVGERSRTFTMNSSVVPLNLSPYGFGVFGTGRLMKPTVVEVAAVCGGAIGAGLRSSIDMAGGYRGVAFGLEVARQYSNLPNLTQIWRRNFSMSIRF